MTVKSTAIRSEPQTYLLPCGAIRKNVAAADARMTTKNQNTDNRYGLELNPVQQ